MKYSLPIVTTYEGRIPDIVESGVGAFFVPQKDSYALATKLEFLINNPELRLKMGIASQTKYEKNLH